MTNNKLTDERLEWLHITMATLAKWGDDSFTMSASEFLPLIVELQERRKADSAVPAMYCMEGEFLDVDLASDSKDIVDGWVKEWNDDKSHGQPLYKTVPLYRQTTPPSPEREQVRREHAVWSKATFGNVGPVGPLKHLSKEALEAAADLSDLSEWADMQFLLWDAQRCAGISDEQITQAMIEKLEVNKQRQWPEPKDGEPRLHVKQPQDAQQNISENIPAGWGMVPDIATVETTYPDVQTNWQDAKMYAEGWNACRAAMLNQAPVKQPSSKG